jgi:hypothetical protein
MGISPATIMNAKEIYIKKLQSQAHTNATSKKFIVPNFDINMHEGG